MPKPQSPPGQPSQRQRRVGEQLRHIIAETLRRGHFHSEILLDKAEQITVTEVLPAPDLKTAKVYVMPLGGMDMEAILPALNEDAALFQKEIGRQANLKFTPRLTFRADESFDTARRIDEILEGIQYSE